jgi:tetratricopeptide (TPR) repeat protein
LAEQAVDVARVSGDRVALAWALQRPHVAIAHPSTLAQRSVWADEACAIPVELGDSATLFFVYVNAALAALERCDGDAIDENVARFEEHAARIPHATVRWNDWYARAWVAGLRGDLAEYERLAEAALSYATENGEPDAFTIYAAQLANIRLHQGRLHELIPLIEQALAETPTLRVYRAVLAYARARAGQIDQATAMLAEDLAVDFPMPEDSTWSTACAYWVETAAVLREVQAAPSLRERLLPYHDQIVSTMITFSPALCHGLGRLDHLIGRYDDAEQWFTEARELHDRVRSPLLVAYTEAAWAEMLADRNQGDDHDRARTMAQAALDAAIAGGYGYVESDARVVLARVS